MAAPPAKECATLGYLATPWYADGTSLRDVTACAGVNVDTVGANVIHGLSQGLATGAVVTAILTTANIVVASPPELAWIKVGNGVILTVVLTGNEISTTNAGNGTATFTVTSTGPLADLFVASGANTQFTTRAKYASHDTAGNGVKTTITVLPQGNVTDPNNTLIQVNFIPLTPTTSQVLTAAHTFKYDTVTYSA